MISKFLISLKIRRPWGVLTPRKSHKTRSRKAREKIIIDKGTFIVPKGSHKCIKWNTTIDGCNILCFDVTTSILLISMDMVFMVG
jgi:hypothetical protein